MKKDKTFSEPNRMRLRSNLYDDLKRVVDKHPGVSPRDKRCVLLMLIHGECSDVNFKPQYLVCREKEENDD